MIMRIPSFENDIVFSENYISVLHIQNGTLFARIIGSINSLINGVEELNDCRENKQFRASYEGII